MLGKKKKSAVWSAKRVLGGGNVFPMFTGVAYAAGGCKAHLMLSVISKAVVRPQLVFRFGLTEPEKRAELVIRGKEKQVNLLRGRRSGHVDPQMKAKSFGSLLNLPSLPSSLAGVAARGELPLCIVSSFMPVCLEDLTSPQLIPQSMCVLRG